MSEIPTAYIPGSSGTVTSGNSGVVRTLQNGVIRLLQDGVTQRILQPNVVTGLIPTEYTPA